MGEQLDNLECETAQRSFAENGQDPNKALLIHYVICPDLIVESASDSHVTLCNRETASRFKLSQAAYHFLKRFHSPSEIDKIAPGASSQLANSIRYFIEKGLLVDANAPATIPMPKQRRTVAVKFCNAPAPHNSLSPADFIMLGIPYDCAGELECRTAPARIREKSLDYEYGADIESGRPRGWMDVNAGCRILEGATIHDAGDMHIDFGESAAKFFSRCSTTIKEATRLSSCPVILGGDQSISYPVIASLQQDMPLTVLRIAPDPHLSHNQGIAAPYQAETYRKIQSLMHVKDVVCFTGKDFLSLDLADQEMPQNKPPKPHSISRNIDDYAATLDQNYALYISIDMALFASSYGLSAVDGAIPGLSWLRPVQQMLKRIGGSHKIAGIDIVGLDSYAASHPLFPVVACHLLLQTMHIAHMYKGARHA